mgnify:CR=1 FL=1
MVHIFEDWKEAMAFAISHGAFLVPYGARLWEGWLEEGGQGNGMDGTTHPVSPIQPVGRIVRHKKGETNAGN